MAAAAGLTDVVHRIKTRGKLPPDRRPGAPLSLSRGLQLQHNGSDKAGERRWGWEWIPRPQLFGDVISGWKSWLALSRVEREEGRQAERGGGRKTQRSFACMQLLIERRGWGGSGIEAPSPANDLCINLQSNASCQKNPNKRSGFLPCLLGVYPPPTQTLCKSYTDPGDVGIFFPLMSRKRWCSSFEAVKISWSFVASRT